MHKLLFDNNISHRVIGKLDTIFSNSSHVMTLHLDESSDLKVWQYAKKNNYTIVTKDSDFNDLVFYKGIPPKVIWIKVANCKVDEIALLIEKNKEIIIQFLEDKKLAVLEI